MQIKDYDITTKLSEHSFRSNLFVADGLFDCNNIKKSWCDV